MIMRKVKRFAVLRLAHAYALVSCASGDTLHAVFRQVRALGFTERPFFVYAARSLVSSGDRWCQLLASPVLPRKPLYADEECEIEPQAPITFRRAP